MPSLASCFSPTGCAAIDADVLAYVVFLLLFLAWGLRWLWQRFR